MLKDNTGRAQNNSEQITKSIAVANKQAMITQSEVIVDSVQEEIVKPIATTITPRQAVAQAQSLQQELDRTSIAQATVNTKITSQTSKKAILPTEPLSNVQTTQADSRVTKQQPSKIKAKPKQEVTEDGQKAEATVPTSVTTTRPLIDRTIPSDHINSQDHSQLLDADEPIIKAILPAEIQSTYHKDQQFSPAIAANLETSRPLVIDPSWLRFTKPYMRPIQQSLTLNDQTVTNTKSQHRQSSQQAGWAHETRSLSQAPTGQRIPKRKRRGDRFAQGTYATSLTRGKASMANVIVQDTSTVLDQTYQLQQRMQNYVNQRAAST